MQTVVLISGGLDSTVALHDAATRDKVVLGLSFDYGSKHNARELPCAFWQCRQLGIPHRIVRLDFIHELFRSDLLQSGGEIPDGHYEDLSMRRTVVPFRNGIMLAIAAGIAESCDAGSLVIAAHGGDHAIYPDCRETFLAPMAEAIRAGTYAGIAVQRPFSNRKKTDLVRRGLELGVDFRHTWSCYKGGTRHCGRCGTCVERREAFQLAGATDPTEYLEG